MSNNSAHKQNISSPVQNNYNNIEVFDIKQAEEN